MDKYIHRGDIAFALLLAFYLTWYNVLGCVHQLTGINIARLGLHFVTVFVLIEIVFGLVCYLRKRPLFGKAKSLFFSWKRIVPISVLVSGGSTLFYYCYLSSPIDSQTLLFLLIGFVAGTILTMLYFYSLVEK